MATGGLLALTALATAQRMRGQRQDEKTARSIAGFNARLSERNAAIAIKSSKEKAGDIRETTKELISKHRAAFGASNLVTTSGSPLLAQLKQAGKGEEAAQDALVEGRMQTAGFSIQASLDEFESSAIQARGSSQRREILLSGASSGAGTAATLINR